MGKGWLEHEELGTTGFMHTWERSCRAIIAYTTVSECGVEVISYFRYKDHGNSIEALDKTFPFYRLILRRVSSYHLCHRLKTELNYNHE